MTGPRRAGKPAIPGPVPAPVVSAPVFVQAMTRADRRCECTRKGCHGQAKRCERAQPGHALILAPRDATVPLYAAWRVPAEGLAVWCSRCHAIALSDGNRVRAEAARATQNALPLGIPAVSA